MPRDTSSLFYLLLLAQRNAWKKLRFDCRTVHKFPLILRPSAEGTTLCPLCIQSVTHLKTVIFNAYNLDKSLGLPFFLHILVKGVFSEKKLEKYLHPLQAWNALKTPYIFPRSGWGKANASWKTAHLGKSYDIKCECSFTIASNNWSQSFSVVTRLACLINDSLARVFPRFSSATCSSTFDWFTGLSASFVIG